MDLMDVVVRTPEKTELVKAVHVFLQAFNLDISYTKSMVSFWQKLYARHVGEFVVATQHETVLGAGHCFPTAHWRGSAIWRWIPLFNGEV